MNSLAKYFKYLHRKLVNNANLVHNLFLVCLCLFSTCFGQLCVHHQEKQLYLCDTWYLLFCMDDCLVCRVEWKLYTDAWSTKHKIPQKKFGNTALYYINLLSSLINSAPAPSQNYCQVTPPSQCKKYTNTTVCHTPDLHTGLGSHD